VRRSLFLLGLPFFGLTSESAPQLRVNLFTQIHEIVFYGKGGYDWETIYNMPIWLRRFTHKQIQDYYSKINNQGNDDNVKKSIEAMKSAGATSKPQSPTKITPATYNMKASKK